MNMHEYHFNGQKDRECPKCKKTYTGWGAISRRDNETEICPECGVKEAFEDYTNYYKTHMEVKGE